MIISIYQIQIALSGFKPKIWRRVLVPSNLLLKDFHNIIQITMGWTNSHLHQFIQDNMFYSVKYPDDDLWDDSRNICYKKNRIRISDLLTFEKDKMIYEYDFGDSWKHDIILEKILPYDSVKQFPICVTGKMNCPPEDCGGIWSYCQLLEIINQPDHVEYEELMEWLGGEFDPNYFNKDEVNEMLKENGYGC